MYRRARSGLIKEFTGVSSPYEEPLNPDRILDTGAAPLEDCVESVISLLRERKVIASAERRDDTGEARCIGALEAQTN
jgi:adenylylsulfate kinase